MVLVLRLHTPVSKGGFVTDAFKIYVITCTHIKQYFGKKIKHAYFQN